MTFTIVQITSIVATLGCLIFLLKGLSRPLSMACYAAAMLPFQISCPFVSAIKVNELAIVLWIVAFIFHTTHKKKIFHSRYAATLFVFMIFVSAFNIFKYFQSGNPGVVTELIRLIVAVVFPLTVSLTFFDEMQGCFEELMKAWNMAALTVCVLSLVSLLFGGYSIVSYFMTYIRRTAGTFYVMKFAASPFIADPNSYGGYLVISIGIAYYLYISTKTKKYLAFTIVEFIGLITTLSRGAILSLLIAFCIVLFINRRTKAIGALSIILGIIGGVSLLIPYFTSDIFLWLFNSLILGFFTNLIIS